MNNLKMIIIHNKDINHNQVNLMVILKYKKIPININKISLKLEKKNFNTKLGDFGFNIA